MIVYVCADRATLRDVLTAALEDLAVQSTRGESVSVSVYGVNNFTDDARAKEVTLCFSNEDMERPEVAGQLIIEIEED